jgi:hypothetical protein
MLKVPERDKCMEREHNSKSSKESKPSETG